MLLTEKITIIIPCLNPDEKMITLIQNLRENKFDQIIVVNDGSSTEYEDLFDQASNKFGCTVLKHHVNLGKGRALKTAFNYFLNTRKNEVGVITVDADGQHAIEDIKATAQKLIEHPSELIMGCRDFSGNHIPFRSKFGNVLTRNVFKMLCGVKVSDTQTGLRGIPVNYLKTLMNVSGERFEFEMNMLIECKQHEIEIQEVPIETIYLEENKSSHFNPLLDSIKIYSVFLRFILSSFSSFLIDISFYTIFIYLLKDIFEMQYIIIATVIARIISSIFNYSMNKTTVFKQKDSQSHSMIKYYTLAIIQMLISGYGVSTLFGIFGFNEVILKLIVDPILFLISFQIQREWVFKTISRGEKQTCI